MFGVAAFPLRDKVDTAEPIRFGSVSLLRIHGARCGEQQAVISNHFIIVRRHFKHGQWQA